MPGRGPTATCASTPSMQPEAMCVRAVLCACLLLAHTPVGFADDEDVLAGLDASLACRQGSRLRLCRVKLFSSVPLQLCVAWNVRRLGTGGHGAS